MVRDLADLPARRFLGLFLTGLAIAAVPILAMGELPLVDYPNHLARMHVIAGYESAASLREFYTITWRPIPDLAMDLIVPALSRVMPLPWAGKAFFLMIFLMIAGGTAALHRELFARWSAWPLTAFLLLYNRSLLWGFGNFLFGVGLVMVALAAWVALRQNRPSVRLLAAIPLAFALYFAHLFAFGTYALAVAALEIDRLRRQGWRDSAARRDLVLAGLPFVLPLAVFLATAHGNAGAIVYSRLVRKLDLLFNIVDNYVPVLDVATFALLSVGFAAAALRRRLALSRLLMPPLALLALVQLVMPNRVLGAAGVDHRLPLILALLLIAASDWRPMPPRGRAVAAAVLAALFLVRTGVVTATWLGEDRAIAPMIAALEQLPRGCRLAVAYPPSAVNVSRGALPVLHIAGYAAVGADCFVPTLFADPGQQPLGFTPPYAALAAAALPGALWTALAEPGKPDLEQRASPRMLDGFDFILFVGRGSDAVPERPMLELRAASQDARLFVVRHEPAGD